MSEPREYDLAKDKRCEEEAKHPISIWTSLAPGDVVAFQGTDTQDYVGTVETKTSDGLIIWIRDELNGRKLFHFRECQSVRVLK
ncbi:MULTISPECIES: hypothetical protein [unclassified Arthrobacter]|uniref:hypothetical protein n=1 Tax=unclassified Arthrobacter TaxID=235627 RepID=UPI001C860F05|nr:hypothetical protein [Arthrobacter sp. MAHUQ-56]MBX7443378.1 hypothetical protein [Arthrobacter sp. MAHUQ-56]